MRKQPARRVGLMVGGVALMGCAGLWLGGGDEPVPASERPLPVVEYVVAKVRDQRATLRAHGRLEAVDRMELGPRVDGCVQHVLPDLVVGKRVQMGTALFTLDPADFRIAVIRAEAALRVAEANWREERGRQAIAEGEWAMLTAEERGGAADPDLVRREPQLQAAQAQLESAQGDLRAAQLALGRTEVRAPFDAIVLAEDVAVGRQVDAGEGLVVLAAAGQWTVDLMVPESAANLVETAPSTRVELWRLGRSEERITGAVQGMLGAVDGRDRQARLRVAIEAAGGQPSPRIGVELEAAVPSRLLPDSVRLPLEALRAGDCIWVLGADDRLEVRPVTVILRSGGEVYVQGGSLDGARVVVGAIAAPLAGMQLQGEARS